MFTNNNLILSVTFKIPAVKDQDLPDDVSRCDQVKKLPLFITGVDFSFYL